MILMSGTWAAAQEDMNLERERERAREREIPGRALAFG